uniref:ABC-type branched-chain amino acid transport system, substrate-binding protein n=1 Tax=Candidatus Kentrum sp. MB TaxID=2138164 RepID=A0A451B949_9GAMM|nr:MAG: ABC-type branched-chain amino acid transport system, substrate-binding protein [Candidatus Kentron sp. MB]VFK29536.1 MAG: ABC-type branched-chain amino acid transport system, substrate-binding protein [Candidatus Kentron sp. MB]VFK74819.1 MAG: ABC-type branched-chain amino acid transport system, substrate-binding protein [Candidatus Kentron sp. MB]
MLSFSPKGLFRSTYFYGFLFVLVCLLLFSVTMFYQKTEYKIGVILSSPEDDSPMTDSIKFLVDKRIDVLNKEGGINGHPVRAVYMDDFEDGSLTKKYVEEIITDQNLLGIVGCWNSTRGKGIVDVIGKTDIPFVGDFSLDTIFSDYRNIYSMARGVSDELGVFEKFLIDNKVDTVAFIGRAEDLYTIEYYRHIKDRSADGAPDIRYEKWLPKSKGIDGATRKSIISGIKSSEADMIILSLGAKDNGVIMEALRENNMKTPVYSVLGVMGKLLSTMGHGFDFDWYDMVEQGMPNIESQRLEELITKYRDDLSEIDSYYYVIRAGGRYADGVGMILDAARNAGSQDMKEIRSHVLDTLHSYISGKYVYKGWSRYWAFTKNKTSSEDILLIWKPADYDGSILYPEQYELRRGQYIRKPVIYLGVDMIRITDVDTSETNFYAEFYLNIKSEDPNVDESYIEFTNADRGNGGNEALISVRKIDEDVNHPNANAEARFLSSHLYKVSGIFDFYPDLRLYPFDEQKFSISFQPKNKKHNFLIQPPKVELRDMDFHTDGWVVKSHYVGMDQDIIRGIEGYVSKEKIMPFYNFSYTWIMERSSVDYFIKIVIPLLIILAITYLSVYMQESDFEAAITTQITALLASIALYFSIYKPITDYATLSDKIFLFTYFAITIMMSASILRSKCYANDSDRLVLVANVMQRYIFPLFVVVMMAYVLFVKYLAE